MLPLKRLAVLLSLLSAVGYGDIIKLGGASGGGSPPTIGGPVASGTTGSVLFVGPGATLAQDGANFSWNDTANRLGIGTTSPSEQVEIKGTAPFFSADTTGSFGGFWYKKSGVGRWAEGIDTTLGDQWSLTRFNAAGAFQEASLRVSGTTGDVAVANRLGIGTTTPGQKLTVEGTLGILEGGGSPTFHTVFQGGDQAANVTYTLPVDDGTSGQFLKTDGSGVLSWDTAGGGAVTSVNGYTGAVVLGFNDMSSSSALTVQDAFLEIQDNGDTTKRIKWQLSNLTTGVLATFSPPPLTANAAVVLVGTQATQSLSNKTFGSTNSFILQTDKFQFQDAVSNQQLLYNLSALTATRTVTFPDADITLSTSLSGTYTVTTTNVSNSGASTGFNCTYTRVQNAVSVGCKVEVDPTLTATTTVVGLSLPIASNFTADDQCNGVAFASDVAGMGAAVRADAVNNRCELVWKATDINNQPMHLNFQYQIL